VRLAARLRRILLQFVVVGGLNLIVDPKEKKLIDGGAVPAATARGPD